MPPAVRQSPKRSPARRSWLPCGFPISGTRQPCPQGSDRRLRLGPPRAARPRRRQGLGAKSPALVPSMSGRGRASVGEGYWRRSHQLPGVLVCPEHLCWLRGARLPKIVGQHDFIAATQSTCPAAAADVGWDTRAVLPGPCLDCPSERVSARRGSSQLDLQRPDRRVSKTTYRRRSCVALRAAASDPTSLPGRAAALGAPGLSGRGR